MTSQCLDDIFFRQLFSLLFGLLLSDVTHDCTLTHFMKALVTQLCFLFRTVYAPSGSLQICQYRTGKRTENNTALETIQMGIYKASRASTTVKEQMPRQQAVCTVWYGMVWYVQYCFSSACLSFPPKDEFCNERP